MEDSGTKEQILGKYLMSLSPHERAFCGRRVKAITAFIESGAELSRAGYLLYLETHGLDHLDSDREYLRDYLYVAGVRNLGGRRKAKGKVVERLEVITETNKKRITAFLEWVKLQRDYSAHSMRMKRDHMIKFFRYFNEFNLANCRDFLTTQEHEGKSPATLNLYTITLRQYGEYQKKPVTLKKISVPRSLSVENVPTEKEYHDFLDWLMQNEKWRMYWAVRILGCTGIRRSELAQLTWGDILSGEFFPLCKGKKRRMVYFPQAVVRDLRKWIKGRDIDISRPLLFLEGQNKIYSDRGFDQMLKNNASKAGFPKEKAHCHAFRHFFAKQFLSKTKDVVQLAELLGHESVDTTRLYLQKSKAEQARDINRYVTW